MKFRLKKYISIILSSAMVLTTFGGCIAKKSDSDIGVSYEVEEERVEKLISDEQQKTLESYSSSLESSNLIFNKSGIYN